MLPPERIYVIAGDYSQFKLFKANLADQMIREGIELKTNDIVYVSKPSYLYGFREVAGYFVGTWRDRDDIEEIVSMIAHRGWAENFIEVEL